MPEVGLLVMVLWVVLLAVGRPIGVGLWGGPDSGRRGSTSSFPGYDAAQRSSGASRGTIGALVNNNVTERWFQGPSARHRLKVIAVVTVDNPIAL